MLVSARMRSAVCALTLLVLGDAAIAQPERRPEPTPEPAPEPLPLEPAPSTDAPLAEPPPAPVVEPLPSPVVVVTEPPLDVTPTVADPATSDTGFRFGSYGRLVVGTDLRGGKPESTNVVAHGPRIIEPSYLELELSYGFATQRGLRLRPVITVAFDATLFHETGEFDAQPALRNAYLDAQVTRHLSAWVGSRMYRGDDIYLFDFWPLDDLNTVGGGVYFRKAEGATLGNDAIELAAHAGVNRLQHPFQFQEIAVPNPQQGATTAVQLDRQRMLVSSSAAYIVTGTPEGLSIKGKVHGELHALPSGTRRRVDADGSLGSDLQQLPSDSGYLVGAELSLFGLSSNPAYRRHLNLYARYARGLAAFDELAPPTSFGPDLETTRASELSFGASGTWDHALGTVMVGALSRRFIDADANGIDPDDGWEYAIDVRPLARVVPDLFVGADVSYQARFPRGLNPNTLRAEDPAVFQIAPMFVYSPMGPSAYDRPQLRLVYRAARLNEGARNLFVPDDPRHGRTWVHFLGVQAEWWFNSSRYR